MPVISVPLSGLLSATYLALAPPPQIARYNKALKHSLWIGNRSREKRGPFYLYQSKRSEAAPPKTVPRAPATQRTQGRRIAFSDLVTLNK